MAQIVDRGFNQDPSICIITPTIGRPSLRVALQSIELSPLDQWIVVGDGTQPAAREIASTLFAHEDGVYYFETSTGRGDSGNPLRDLAMTWGYQDYFLFLDDDDVFVPNARRIINEELKRHFGAPVIFRMTSNGDVIWRHPSVEVGNVGGSMIAVPNRFGLIGTWANGHGHRSDYEFIMDTLRRYGSDWRQIIGWAGDIIIHCRTGETYE